MTAAVAAALAHSEAWVLEAPEADEEGVGFSAEFFKATRTHTDGVLGRDTYKLRRPDGALRRDTAVCKRIDQCFRFYLPQYRT